MFAMFGIVSLALAFLPSLTSAYLSIPNSGQIMSGLVVNGIPPSKRVEYMHPTNEALYRQYGPCSFASSGSVIINHTTDAIVCEGTNVGTGDPTITERTERSAPLTPTPPNSPPKP
jgi:hypothetical protein